MALGMPVHITTSKARMKSKQDKSIERSRRKVVRSLVVS